MDARRIIVALALVGVLAFALVLPMDLDGDDLTTVQEWSLGTDGLDRDSDGDGLPDGRERALGSDPIDRDGDGDGLSDFQEVTLGLDWRDPDMDDDGVLDGAEGHTSCVVRTDCDGDGLPDGQEAPDFDALDADTYDVGLDDAVVAAFAAEGQEPDQDRDRDGIPDAWEDSEGLIDWGPFDPQPGRRDLLVEFLKVSGPSSGRFTLDMQGAYQDVAQMFQAEADIHLQWIETPVARNGEHRPGFLDTDDLGYYRDVLESGQGSTNPYVTSIVLNPQQEQEDLAGDVLGAAFLRSMIATVDYGAHVAVTFVEESSDGIVLTGGASIPLSPVLESHIINARPAQVRQLNLFAQEGIVDLGTTSQGVYLITRDDGTDFRWDWRNDWFVTAPNITTQDGSYLQLRATGASLDAAGLASTIAHELGHTLGLCHAHEEDCYMQFDARDISVARIDSTTMSYTAPPQTLHFLGSEWNQVDAYLTCPPQEPVRLLTKTQETDAFYAAKYETSFEAAQTLRSCGEAYVLSPDLAGDDGRDQAPGRDGVAWAWLVTASSLLAGAWVAWRLR